MVETSVGTCLTRVVCPVRHSVHAEGREVGLESQHSPKRGYGGRSLDFGETGAQQL